MKLLTDKQKAKLGIQEYEVAFLNMDTAQPTIMAQGDMYLDTIKTISVAEAFSL